MKALDFGRNAVYSCLGAALFSGCALSTAVPRGAPIDALQRNSSSTYTVLYNFGGSPTDGDSPQAGLTEVEGKLYGTTVSGGSGCYSSGGCGTVFKITVSGKESVLHSFTGGEDGALPSAGLMKVDGVLYGTTGGGASTGGTAFSISTSGNETVLHHFEGVQDGADPQAALIGVDGALLGTTEFGGRLDQGTVFKIAASGGETVIHSFAGKSTHGRYPESSLLSADGALYGTTYEGGVIERGTVFVINSSGNGHVLHNFKGGPADGSYPRAGLVDVNGMFYGTTTSGGNGRCKGCGNHGHYGTVFRISRSGRERVIYKFKGYPSDGADPEGELLYVKGVLYGTTESGGANCAVSHGCGTIFSITPSGSEKMLYSFLPRSGAHPVSGLLDFDDVLYGTTVDGGTYDAGTVYSLTL